MDGQGAQRMAAEFQGQFQEGCARPKWPTLKKSFDEVRRSNRLYQAANVMTSLEKDVGNALRIDNPRYAGGGSPPEIPGLNLRGSDGGRRRRRSTRRRRRSRKHSRKPTRQRPRRSLWRSPAKLSATQRTTAPRRNG